MPIPRLVLTLLVLGAGTTPGAGAQQTRYAVSGPALDVDALDDLDGDGRRELLVRTPFGAKLVSGATGALLRHHGGPGLAVDIAGGGDHSGDGRADYAVATELGGIATVVVHDGATGAELRRFDGRGEVEFVGDLDGDARAELVVGPPSTLISSVDGSVLHSFAGLRRARAVGDLDGDGGEELLLDDEGSAQAVLVSGLGPVELHRFPVATVAQDGGQDVDGDGTPDLLLRDSASEQIVVHAGAGFHELHRVGPFASGPGLGSLVGDADGDGCAEILVGNATEEDADGAYRGVSRLLSGKTGLLLYSFVEAAGDNELGRRGVAMGDLDGDGMGEVALAGLSSAQVVEGASFYLDMWPRHDVRGGELITFTTSRGIPGSVSLRYLLAVDGVPFLYRLDTARLDANGQRIKFVVNAPGLGALDLDEAAFAFDHTGKLVATRVEVLRLR